MSAELDELYQSIILDHNRRPKNFREMDDATAKADGMNPLCGDQLTVWIKLEGDQLTDVSFRGQGCAISTNRPCGRSSSSRMQSSRSDLASCVGCVR